MNIKLHHFAYNVTPNSLELVLEFFELLGCSLAYREGNARWCMIWQKDIPIDIQIIEVSDKPVIPTEKKIKTHIAFLSDDPQEYILKIEKWAQDKGIDFQKGDWSEKELWFDLPDVFVNFVVEIMHESVVE